MSLPPLRRQVVVPAGAPGAFDVFTQRIGTWWPLHRFSVHGAGSSAAFRDGVLVETGPDGAEAIWGEVLDWQPPHRLRITWHPGYDAARASEVEVSFAPVTDTLTLVTVEHRGWERFADPAAARDEYRNGWPGVLAGYAQAVSPAPPSGSDPVVLVLSHTPAPGIGNPFEHPGFAGHAAFLKELAGRGVLVAAGPFPGSGEGMTVIRLGSPGDVADLVRAAAEDDAAVAGGVLEVRVRPWVVMMSGTSPA
jgi:uncharacterized protein YndB with AHSA1/START domain/uncharacterized protein YciI